MREAGTIRERVFQALIKRYTADQEEALVKIDALIKGEVVPGHEDITGSIKAPLWHKLGSPSTYRDVGDILLL